MYVVIFDYSCLFHISRCAALSAGAVESNLRDLTIKNVLGKLRTVERGLNEIGVLGYSVAFAEDRVAKRKLEIMPSYRAGHQDLSSEKNEIKEHMIRVGFNKRFCFSENNEADDTIASMAALAVSKEFRVVIVALDKDMWQLLSEQVQVYNPIKQAIVQGDDVFKAFQCFPWHIPLHKALWGDAGDCVPNVMPRMQKHILPILLLTDGTLADFEAKMYERRFDLNGKCWEMYTASYRDICRNYSLVKLDAKCELRWE